MLLLTVRQEFIWPFKVLFPGIAIFSSENPNKKAILNQNGFLYLKVFMVNPLL